MAAKKRSNRPGIGVGLTTLVTIFVVLLLTAFSVLALASARADMSFSVKASQAVGSYYSAEREASQWVASVEDLIGGREATAWQKDIVALKDNTEVRRVQSGLQLSHNFEYDKTHVLEVHLLIAPDGSVKVTEWRNSVRDASWPTGG
ncbi:MAG: hypothetical protein FWF71_05660 [Actinomycetia bacterium]|nr:hypothetical protein [Actinomycetes bacterium]